MILEKNGGVLNSGAGQALSEKESRDMIKAWGIPVAPAGVARTPEEAVRTAEGLGFPVVLKGFGRSLLHKTEQGLVHVNLTGPDQVRNAARAVSRNAKDRLEGFLIQPFLQGKRELIAGLFYDDLFGPVVMFGIGGIFAEAVSDVVFRIAPIGRADALEMLSEIRAQKLLGDFRGEKAVNTGQVVDTLMALSRVGMEEADIREIDINPLLVSADGDICAVDALVIRGDPVRQKTTLPPLDPGRLEYFFHPKSVAFVGISAQIRKWGHMLFSNVVSGGYKGEIYLVNPKGGRLAGRTVYKSVLDIPGKVDLAVVTIPAHQVIELIPLFHKKEIKNMLLITAGFGETGQEGRQMELDLMEQARQAGILIVGSNTMGICNPHIDFYCTGTHVRPRAGFISIIAQSGNMGTQLLAFAEQQGIGIRCYCGSGNEGMLTIEDFVEALEFDPMTRTIMLYMESAKNGRRFFESLRRVGKKKPIILLKGGTSAAGNRAARSHTGALASDLKVFNAVCRQAGVVTVDLPMNLLDLSSAFSCLPLPAGNRAAIMTLGGGWGVVTADICSQYGLEVPELSPEIIKRIDNLLPSFWSRSNPVDMVGDRTLSLPLAIMEELMRWDGCDGVINLGILGRRILLRRLATSVKETDPGFPSEVLEDMIQQLSDFEKEYIELIVKLMEKYNKPVFGASMMPDEKHQTVFGVGDSAYKGLFYPTPERAVKAFSKMYEYRRFQDRAQRA
ncbi:MAG: acetate--CoA ligase family protein [Desulfobacterales bacterium]|nr:acetate--CoA ligase family protein [Desulfobacterales bacterium]